MRIIKIDTTQIPASLLEEIKKGDVASFKRFFTILWNPLLNFTNRIVKDVQISENILQDVFIHVWENRATIDSNRNLKSYLYTAAKNRALNHLKLSEKYFKNIPEDVTIQGDDPEDKLINEEMSESINRAINKLPEQCRFIFLMNKNDKLTYREISEILNISQKTVETQMSRALKKLRVMLDQLIKMIIFIKIFFPL